MKDFVIKFVNDFGPIEWLLVWAVLIAPPFVAFGIAISSLQKRENRQGLGFLIVGLALTGLVGLLLWSAGMQMIQMTVTSAGAFVIGILVVAALCVLVFPISWTGSQLRAAFEYRRRGFWPKHGRRAFTIGVSGVSVLAVIGMVIYRTWSPAAATVFCLLTLGVLVLGWFGRFLVPDID